MATAPPEIARWRLGAVRALAWALLIGGWLALGALGRLHTLRWAEGLLPLAAWLLAVGSAQRWARERLLTGAAVRSTVAVSGLAAAAACAASSNGGGTAAVFVAALCWGVLLVAASCGVRLARGGVSAPPPPVLPAALGAAAAWLGVGMGGVDPAAPSVPTVALGLLGVSALLCFLLPPRACSRGCRSGLFDCALPLDGLAWRKPSAWAAQAARWSMLPMMATLALMAPWCGELGLSPSRSVALHLAAMLLPPLLLQRLRTRALATVLGTGMMVAGPLLLAFLPGLRGLMALSLCQACAWGLFWHARRARGPFAGPRLEAAAWAAALPALAVAGIGLATAAAGPTALAIILVALAGVACLGTAASQTLSFFDWKRQLNVLERAAMRFAAVSRFNDRRSHEARFGSRSFAQLSVRRRRTVQA